MLKPSIATKLEIMLMRHEEIMHLLSAPDVASDTQKFMKLSKEYAELGTVVEAYQAYKRSLEDMSALEELLSDSDPELKAMAEDDYASTKKRVEDTENSLQTALLPRDPDDNKNIFIEIRAGAGGDEAAIFSGDLYRMYSRYAEGQGWGVEILSLRDGDHGGYKEIILRVKGQNVYSKLKFESGAHRVQRVPETEAQGRIHTSTCTVAVLPEVEEVDSVQINPADLRIDTFRASGAGGQHVNKTDSAVRITHIPTGVVVECQDDRSQHKNKARAMSVLQAKLLQADRDKQMAAQAQTRKSLVGTGDRSERIRTYNYPQGRLTDHRINLTLYQLGDIMEGALSQIIDPLCHEYQAELLATLEKNQ